jgi:L-malate glycosyltransferase
MEHVVVTGPAAPGELLNRDDAPAGLGGTPVNELVKTLIDLGRTVELVTTSYDIEEPWIAEAGSLRVVAVPGRSAARTRALDLFARERRLLRRALMQTSGRFIHAHWTYEFAWAALDTGRDCLVTAHDSPFSVLRNMPDPYRVSRTAMAVKVRRRTVNLSAVSPFIATKWRSQLRYKRSIDVIPNSIPRDVESGYQNHTTADPARILEVADPARWKNVGGLLAAFQIVKANHPTSQLRIAGPGLGPQSAHAQHARDAGLHRGVTFLGPLTRKELIHEYERATVLAHASLQESFSLVVLEAMAMGVPVMAGLNSGGTPWVLAEGACGLLVDTRRPESMAEGLNRLLDDANLRTRLSAAAYRSAHERFSVTSVARAYLAAYDRVANQ